MTNPEARPDSPSGRRARIDTGSSTPLTRRQLRDAQLEREAQAARDLAAQASVPKVLSRRERIAAESAAAAASPVAPAVEEAAAVEAVPVVTTEIVVVPVAEPAPLTRRQLRERAQRELERQVELRAEEIADLEIANLDSGALEPDVELALEVVEPEAEGAGLTVAEPAVHLVRPSRVDRAPVRSAASTGSVATSTAAAGPFVARSASLALALPTAPADVATISGPAASRSRASAATPSLPAKKPRSRVRRGGWAKAGLTAVAMTFVLGITAVTAIPSTVSASPVDANVVNLSLTAGTAPAPQQLITASSASEVVNRDGYGVTDAGQLQAAGYSTAQLLVGRSLAQELVNAVDSGKLVGSTPDHIKEIRWIAQGVTVPDCGVDYRVLEIIAIAVRNFDQVGVSDINRKCTGQIEGAGTSSSHYIDGGGHAVDFYLLNNKSLDGTDPGTLKLISLLDPVMPVGAHVGQAECRAAAGIKLQLTNWTEFDDTCTHMHVDVPVTDAPLLLTDDSLLAAQ